MVPDKDNWQMLKRMQNLHLSLPKKSCGSTNFFCIHSSIFCRVANFYFWSITNKFCSCLILSLAPKKSKLANFIGKSVNLDGVRLLCACAIGVKFMRIHADFHQAALRVRSPRNDEITNKAEMTLHLRVILTFGGSQRKLRQTPSLEITYEKL